MQVRENTIRVAAKKEGADFKSVQNETKVGLGCTSCINTVLDIIEEEQK